MIRYIAALALLVPVAASAQTASRSQPMTLEIVATGEIDAPASSLAVPVTFTVQGATQEAAEKAKAAKHAELLKVLKNEGVAASALTPLAEDDPARMALTTTTTAAVTADAYEDALAEADKAVAEGKEGGEEKAAESEEPAQVILSDGYSLRLATLAQVKLVTDALTPLEIQAGAPVAELDDPAVVQRQAKAKALRSARADAAAYATELGLRVGRVSRISEAGNNLLLPGMQAMVNRMMAAGPKAFTKAFESKPGTVRVTETIIVEFVLAP